MLGNKGGIDPSTMDPAALEEAARAMKGMGGGGIPGMPRGMTLPSGLSGLTRKK